MAEREGWWRGEREMVERGMVVGRKTG